MINTNMEAKGSPSTSQLLSDRNRDCQPTHTVLVWLYDNSKDAHIH